MTLTPTEPPELHVFMDTEFTNLDPTLSELTEVAAVVCDSSFQIHEQHSWFLPVSLAGASDQSLAVQRFHERHPDGNSFGDRRPGVSPYLTDPLEMVEGFAFATHRAHIYGLLPYNDTERITALFVRHGRRPSWVHRLIDVEAYAAGRLGVTPPYSSESLGQALGVPDQPAETRHTALGDALWTRELFLAARGFVRNGVATESGHEKF
jgi:DNA polymerase III epsilon subunit-like protein